MIAALLCFLTPWDCHQVETQLLSLVWALLRSSASDHKTEPEKQLVVAVVPQVVEVDMMSSQTAVMLIGDHHGSCSSFYLRCMVRVVVGSCSDIHAEGHGVDMVAFRDVTLEVGGRKVFPADMNRMRWVAADSASDALGDLNCAGNMVHSRSEGVECSAGLVAPSDVRSKGQELLCCTAEAG